jgi:hypothetical protein
MILPFLLWGASTVCHELLVCNQQSIFPCLCQTSNILDTAPRPRTGSHKLLQKDPRVSILLIICNLISTYIAKMFSFGKCFEFCFYSDLLNSLFSQRRGRWNTMHVRIAWQIHHHKLRVKVWKHVEHPLKCVWNPINIICIQTKHYNWSYFSVCLSVLPFLSRRCKWMQIQSTSVSTRNFWLSLLVLTRFKPSPISGTLFSPPPHSLTQVRTGTKD